MSETLRKALRDEMFSVLNEGELTPAMCSTLMRLAESARELLRARSKKPEDFEGNTEHAGDQELPALNTETYGVKMLKELLPVLQQKFAPKPAPPDTAKLVEALAVARKEGLKDVAESLEEQLGLHQLPIGTHFGEPLSGFVYPMAVGKPEDAVHAGRVIDEKFRCEVSDCWCRYATNSVAKPAPASTFTGTVSAVAVLVEKPEGAP